MKTFENIQSSQNSSFEVKTRVLKSKLEFSLNLEKTLESYEKRQRLSVNTKLEFHRQDSNFHFSEKHVVSVKFKTRVSILKLEFALK